MHLQKETNCHDVRIYFFFTYLTSYITSPPLPWVCSQEDICLSRWKKSRLEAVCLDLLLPGLEQPTVGGGLFTLLTAQTVILTRKPPRLWLHTERRENYLNKEKSDFYGYTDTLDRKVRLWGEMKGLRESFPIAETKAKPTGLLWRAPHGVNFGQCCESLCGRYNIQWELSEKNFVLLTQKCWERLLSVPGDPQEMNKALTSARNHQQAPFLRRIYRFMLFACGLMENTLDNR